jgi:hypothetical protein
MIQEVARDPFGGARGSPGQTLLQEQHKLLPLHARAGRRRHLDFQGTVGLGTGLRFRQKGAPDCHSQQPAGG